jgi:hypothetical protein
VIDQADSLAPRWDRVAIVRYPSRSAFLAMQRRADFQEKHVHKDAGMEQTIVLLTVPADPSSGEVTPAAPDATERHPVLIEVVPSGAASSEEQDHLTLRVEGEVIGDGRSWEAVRLLRLPESEPEPPTAIGGYAVVVQPSIDRLTGGQTLQ